MVIRWRNVLIFKDYLLNYFINMKILYILFIYTIFDCDCHEHGYVYIFFIRTKYLKTLIRGIFKIKFFYG